MARKPRLVAINYPHHVTQRSNHQQQIFYNEADYNAYLCWLAEYSSQYFLEIIAYCLMPNHVHFISIPFRKSSLAKVYSITHMRYAKHFNSMHNITGHLWQGRFHSDILDEKHIYAAARYIENNPVKAGMVKNPEDWQWSSARAHLHKEATTFPLNKIYNFIDVADWKEYLSLQEDDDSIMFKDWE